VLFVSVLTAYTNRALTVYGDGPLVVTQYSAERKIVREKVFWLHTSETRELLQIAVDHGPVEYDETDELGHVLGLDHTNLNPSGVQTSATNGF